MPVAPEQVIGRVAGKVAFVTGAARGIGRACAIRMAEEGADVALVDVAAQVDTVPYAGAQPKQLQSVANEIRNLGRAPWRSPRTSGMVGPFVGPPTERVVT